MTERIDLDDVDVEPDDEQGGDREGDWLWRDDDAADIDGDPRRSGSGGGGDAGADAGDTAASAESSGDSQGDRVPHVPYESSGSPAGIPKDRGGAGGGAGPADDRPRAPESGEDDGESVAGERAAGAAEASSRASGPHGGGVDDMATAYTYEAVQRLADPRAAFAETNEFSDWVGLVGDVPAHAINKFLRDHGLDADFFNGSGDGPAERLAAVDEHSMFYSDRMVVVGTASEAWIAEEAGWEFVELSEAAEGAGWSLAE
ncbi:DUF7124 domain-containing protein [Halobacterium yunchengense]|uniref:DUF7124 domain-containing protein n=1 Tax=Halobacterium yunchengense TaxID=3108497 RepID=UPI00300BAF2E